MPNTQQKLPGEQLSDVLAAKKLQLTSDEYHALVCDVQDVQSALARKLQFEKIPFSVVQIAESVAEIMEPRAAEKNLEFSINADDAAECFYLGDAKRLQRIILALCDNAIKYTEDGGVDVLIVAIPGGKDKMETVCVSVEDTGAGIARKDMAAVFELFTQLDNPVNKKNPAAGVGLAYAKIVAEAMGGTLTVSSDMDEGSSFELRLPLQPATYQDNEQSDEDDKAPVAEARPCVLLVEDYEANVLVASSFLEHFGYAVDVATNGEDAVEMIKAKPYMAVLMDVQMPGINGYEATKLVREFEAQQNRTPAHVIGMTAYAMAGDREHCIAEGMDDYISKPFNPDVLKEKLHALMLKRTLRQF